MAYSEDARTLAALVRYRYVTFAVVLVALVVEYGLHWRGMGWVRAVAWAVAAVISWKEAKVCRRMGRNPDGAYLRVVAYAAVAIFNVVV